MISSSFFSFSRHGDVKGNGRIVFRLQMRWKLNRICDTGRRLMGWCILPSRRESSSVLLAISSLFLSSSPKEAVNDFKLDLCVEYDAMRVGPTR